MTPDQEFRLAELRLIASRLAAIAVDMHAIVQRYEADADDLQTSIDMAVIGGYLCSQLQFICDDVPMPLPFGEPDEPLLESVN